MSKRKAANIATNKFEGYKHFAIKLLRDHFDRYVEFDAEHDAFVPRFGVHPLKEPYVKATHEARKVMARARVEFATRQVQKAKTLADVETVLYFFMPGLRYPNYQDPNTARLNWRKVTAASPWAREYGVVRAAMERHRHRRLNPHTTQGKARLLREFKELSTNFR